MLELCKQDSITVIENLKDFITVVFVIIDDIYQYITPAHIKNRRNVNTSIMSDSEIIPISLVGELMSIDSENLGLVIVRIILKTFSLDFVIEPALTEPEELL